MNHTLHFGTAGACRVYEQARTGTPPISWSGRQARYLDRLKTNRLYRA